MFFSLKNLTKLKKLDISFKKFEVLPELNESNSDFEFLDISHNNIDKLDESNNSKQVSLQFYVNDQYFLSQLIIKIKTIWEKIFLRLFGERIEKYRLSIRIHKHMKYIKFKDLLSMKLYYNLY